MSHFFSSIRSSLPIGLLLSLGFLFFPWWLVIPEIIFGMVVWNLLGPSKKEPPMNKKVFGCWFLALFALIMISRLWAFALADVPLGYDTGIYRYEFWSSFQRIPEYVSGLFLGLPLLSNVILLFGGSVDDLLSSLYVFCSLLLPVSLAFVARRWWGTRAALVVLFLFAISLIQWKAFTMMLFKQELALALVFFGLWLLEQRTFLLLPILMFIALLQPLDAFFLGECALIFLLVQAFRSRAERVFVVSFFGIGIIAGLLVLWLDPSFWSQAWNIFQQGIADPRSLEASLQQGVFLSLEDYGYQAAFVFVFGIIGLLLDIKKRGFTALTIYFGLLVLWIAFGLFFFQRLVIQLDAVLLLYSGFALLQGWSFFVADRFGKILGGILLLAFLVPIGLTIGRYKPLIQAEELNHIQLFCGTLPPEATLVATDSFYGPWLKGYCLDQQVFAPGLFGHPWSRADWELFWAGDAASLERLLTFSPEPLYFYVGEQQPTLELDPKYFQWVERGWWKALRP